MGATARHEFSHFPDAKGELLKLNQALLVLFLELLSVLVEQPSAYAEAVTKVIAALQNMQYLVNALRPQQVRPAPAGAAALPRPV